MANTMLDLPVPGLGESVSEATIANWVKQDGDYVTPNDVVAELETDKATVELPAGKSGTLKIVKNKGETVAVGDVIARIDPAGKPSAAPAAAATTSNIATSEQAKEAPAAKGSEEMSPAVRRIATENKVDVGTIAGTGKDGRVTKGDVIEHLEKNPSAAPLPHAVPAQKAMPGEALRAPGTTAVPDRTSKAPETRPIEEGAETRVEMSKLRQTIARRLVESQHATASLTTFNEIDMSAILALREKYKEKFEKDHKIGLGFMSFFAKAVIHALKSVPAVNASIEGNSLIYRKYVHLGIAVSTEKGLMVPVIRNADQLSMADIESEIKRLAAKAREGKITIEEMSGGTFTITNGGVFGSLLSTPILNPPQSGILGMHKIEKRAVVVTEGGEDKIVVKPMMYVALTYDHRVIDGQQSVTFLVKVKEAIEDPTRMLLSV